MQLGNLMATKKKQTPKLHPNDVIHILENHQSFTGKIKTPYKVILITLLLLSLSVLIVNNDADKK